MKKNNFLICFNILLLIGCGTKGELYIPEEKYPQSKIDKYQYKVINDQTQSA